MHYSTQEENRLRKIREDRERYQREQAERDAQQRRCV